MDAQSIRTKLENDESVFGLFAPYKDPVLIELLCASGLDFIIFDGEHGPINECDMPALALAAERRNCMPIARIPCHDRHIVGRFLDYGAQGLVAPMINTREDGVAFTEAALFPPQGNRGVAQTRALDFGIGESIPQKLVRANNSLLTIAQIETLQALENIDEILSIDRLDVVFIGPADLSTSLGHSMDFEHPEFIAAMLSISAATQKSGKHLGVLVGASEQVPLMHSLGVRFFVGYSDILIVDACRNFVTECSGNV